MKLLFEEYFVILVFIALSVILALVLYALSYLIASQNSDVEKDSAYECGYDPFDDARTKFDVRFYLVAILFIIFDLEVTFLFPWALTLGRLTQFGYWTMIIFLGILTIGIIYEWKKGALEWE